MARTRKNSPVRKKTPKCSIMMPNNDDEEMQLAVNTNVEPTHDSDASSISSNGVQNTDTSSNVSLDTLVQNSVRQTLKTISVVLKPVKNNQIQK